MMRWLLRFGVVSLVAALPAGVTWWPMAAQAGPSGAPTFYVVGKGEKLDAIAKRFGVNPRTLASSNHLKETAVPRPGTRLIIPPRPSGRTYEATPKHPGRVTFVRLGTQETQTLQLTNRKGKLVPGVLPRMARLMRFGPLNMEHPIDPRLVLLIAQVSDHFGGRPIEIISGFRPKRPGQYTAHSNHNVGHAIDMRIPGVPNEVLRDYCRTFSQTGVGYYPNSLFVHFDVREKSTYWVDLSRPGEAPRYVGPGGDVDHGVDDTSREGVDLTPRDESTGTTTGAVSAGGTTSSSPPAPTSSPSSAPLLPSQR